MPDHDTTEYSLASITEFGVATANYEEVLRDLRARQLQRQSRGFECDHRYAAVMGSTDLVEISRFNHYFHLSAVGGSSAQAFRRSIGVLCPQAEVLKGSRPEVNVLGKVLRPSETNPLLAVMYLKQSPISAICRTQPLPSGGVGLQSRMWSPVQQQLLRYIGWNEDLWHSYEEVLEATLSSSPLSESPEAVVKRQFGVDEPKLPSIQVAPLLGLDSVEVVLVVRAVCLEQMAALAFVMRYQTLNHVWPVTEGSSALEAVRRLLSERVVPEDWNSSPLFSDTTTVVGMPLRPPGDPADPRSKKDWTLETAKIDDCVARQAVVIKRSRLVGGGQPEALEPWTDSVPAGPPTESRQADGRDFTFLMLFDRSDALSFKTDFKEALNHMPPLRRLGFRELEAHLVQLLNREKTPEDAPGTTLDPYDSAFRSVRSALSVAVRVTIPQSVLGRGLPSQTLTIAFHDALRLCRQAHLTRDKGGLWTRQWLDRTRKLGTIYSLTNSGVNLIASVLDYLEDDLEGFIDLLPVIEHLIGMVDDPIGVQGEGYLVQSDLVWFYRQTETLAFSRGRRDHPLRLPRDTLSFEGHAGYRTSRDACQAFLESLTAVGNSAHQGQIMLLDSSGDGISCRPGRLDSTAISASAMVLHHPFYWGVFAHELGHSLFHHVRFDDPKAPLSQAGQRVKTSLSPAGSVLYDPSAKLGPEESVQSLFTATQLFFQRHRYEKSPISLMAESLGMAIEEVPADMLLWATLFRDVKDLQSEDLFWFLVGPTLMFTVQHDVGSLGPEGPRLGSIFLRWFFVDRLIKQSLGLRTDADKGPLGWVRDFANLVAELKIKSTMGDGQDGRIYRDDPSDDSQLLYRFRCLKQDLEISDGIWFDTANDLDSACVYLLKEEEEREEEGDEGKEKERIRNVIDAWLALIPILSRQCIGDLSQNSPGRNYLEYLTALRILCGDPVPWLPMVPSHELQANPVARWADREEQPQIAISRRGGILANGESLRRYNEVTLQFISSLQDQARKARYSKLETYIRGVRERQGG